MIQTILTPIDGSKHAQAALNLSIDLAAKYDALIVLLHVGIHDDNVPEDLYNAASREFDEAQNSGEETGGHVHQSRHLQILEYMGHMLLRNADQQAKENGVKRTQTVIEFGDAGELILHHAKHRSADLIVMGTRGFSKLERLFMGSVSHKVFHLASCSCVTVHFEDTQPALEGIKSILVPTDGSDQADKAVDIASDIAVKYGAKLILLYVIWRGPSLETFRASIDMDQLSESAREELDPERHPIAEHVSSAFIAPVISGDTAREIGEQVLSRGQRTAEAKGVRSPKLLLLDGDPARAIVGAAQREQADLIAMGSHGLGMAEGLLAGSVSYKVSHTASCSFMIVR